MDIDSINREWQVREMDRINKEENERKERAAIHLKNCMDYDDACEMPPSDPGNLKCKIGWHFGHRIWNPRWTKYTYGHCTRCSRSIGTGISDSDGY